MKGEWRPPPSRLYLPKLKSPPPTILDYMIAHFPEQPRHIWLERAGRGLVTFLDGATVREDTPYRYGVMVCYWKEVAMEPEPSEVETILWQDDQILVADKPHGMPVTPAGEYLERSLLIRLQRSAGSTTLAPMHRLDHATAGIVLFTLHQAARRHYHRLFADRTIEREYLAVARVDEVPEQTRWRVENRMEAGDPWFRQRIVDGPVNAITGIELLELQDRAGLFRLTPETGRKHQLRAHMASIGFPVLGDLLYPQIRDRQEGDPDLQLLARRLAFIDPLNGIPRSFVSARRLSAAGPMQWPDAKTE